MAYSDFTLRSAVKAFGLSDTDTPDLHAAVPSVEPAAAFAALLADNAPLAVSINSEFARSTLLLAPILSEAKRLTNGRLQVLPGVTFEVDKAAGLTGMCDFLLSVSPKVFYLKSPVVAVVEAKREDLTAGLGQCAAELVAVQRFNESDGTPLSMVHGVVTSGTNWRFLRLAGTDLLIDRREYGLSELPKILGILVHLANTA